MRLIWSSGMTITVVLWTETNFEHHKFYYYYGAVVIVHVSEGYNSRMPHHMVSHLRNALFPCPSTLMTNEHLLVPTIIMIE